MTQNQINYARLKEEQRHNLATEGYTGVELAETSRHNIQSENINWYSASEAGRHNQATENINWYTALKQGESYAAQAYRNMAEANLATTRAEQVSKDYELERDKFQHQVWKDVRTLGIEEDKYDLSKEQVHKSMEKIDAEIAHMFYEEGLDFERYRTDYAKARGSVFQSVSNGIKNITDAALELFDWGWGMINGIHP